MIGTDVWIVKGDFRAKYGVYKIGGGMFGTLKPESTEESWNLFRSVGEGLGKVAVRV